MNSSEYGILTYLLSFQLHPYPGFTGPFVPWFLLPPWQRIGVSCSCWDSFPSALSLTMYFYPPPNSKWKWKVKVKSLSRVRLFATPWTVAHQAPLSMRFPRQEYRSGLPCPPLGDLPDPGRLNPCLLHWQADSVLSESVEFPVKYFQKEIAGSHGFISECSKAFKEQVINFIQTLMDNREENTQ